MDDMAVDSDEEVDYSKMDQVFFLLLAVSVSTAGGIFS